MSTRCFIPIIVLVSFQLILVGQKPTIKELSRLVQNGRYVDALQYASELESSNKEYYFYRGLAHFEMRNIPAALDDLSFAYSNGYNKNDILYFLALSHHLLEQFDEASQAYKRYLITLDKDDPKREKTKLYIKHCGYGINAIFFDQAGFVENLGPVVNTPYDDYGPVFSPNYEKKIYFSSNRSESSGGLRNELGLEDEENGYYAVDIFAAEMKDGRWEKSRSIPPFLNSPANEEIQDFCADGTVLIFNRTGPGEEGLFLADTFSTDLNNETYPIFSSALSSHGDQDLFFINDSTIIFSSRRKNGYGGFDLYITERIGNEWSPPVNLGPQINSIYDERSPFLVSNGTILYFSSNRENSLGGFDVFQSRYGIERSQWQTAENVGYPISSPGDDLHFRLGQNGRSALFSSDRMNSLGGKDIFIAYLKNQVLEQITSSDFNPFKLNKMKSPGTAGMDSVTDLVENFQDEELSEIKQREIVLSPLFFSETNKVLEGNNLSEINNIIDIMLIYPETKIILSGFTSSEGNKAYELYFSIKNAEIVADYLMDNGIEGHRIHLFGYGAQYPMVLDKNSSLAERNNQRIDVQLINDNPSLIVGYNNPKIVDILQDKRFQTYKDKMNKAFFRINAIQSRQLLDDPRIIRAKDVTTFKYGSDDTYTYLVGFSDSYKEILSIKSIMDESGITTRSIVAYVNGMPITKDEVKNYVSSYSNLKEYSDNE